jgi:type II secretory ATPase GspE/PulE/Tfp pilus assembly ATPase PilB-like protein
MPTFYGEKITMRLLLSGLKPLSFQELGMTSEQIAMVEKNIKKTFGMVLSTGPTSSGKTTTQYSILSYLNKPEVNIVTIEDPIEYELRYINQTQVNPKAGIDFASGLRAFLRHDPNIIMVGEIRDFDTADVSTNAALTGHLVLSTLHTNDAPTAIPRLVDMGVPPFLVSATLNIVMAQRLVRRICPDCIESYEIDDLTKEAIISQVKQLGEERLVSFSMPEMLYRGKGCRNCNYTGYRGRLAIFEMLDVDSDIRNYIVRKDFTLDGLKKIMAQKEMKTMFEDGLDKAKLGQTTVQEILRVIRE